MKWARVEDGVVVHVTIYDPAWVWEGDPITIAAYQPCPDEVMALWTFDGTTWSPHVYTQLELEAAFAAEELIRKEAAELARIARVTAAIVTNHGMPTDQTIASVMASLVWPDDFV